MGSESSKPEDPYAWQQDALRQWEGAEKRGMVQAMTGTGKTHLAIRAIEKVRRENERPVSILVVVPKIALMQQWYSEIKKAFPEKPVGRIGGNFNDNFSRAEGMGPPVACVAVIHSAVKRTFPGNADETSAARGLLGHCQGREIDSFLIADECHHYVSEEARVFHRILRFPFKYTLGLSATIFDFEVDGLGKIIFDYGIKQANRDGLVPSFDVINVGVELSASELKKYLELEDAIKKQMKRIHWLFGSQLRGCHGDRFWGRLKQLSNRRPGKPEPLIQALFANLFTKAAIYYTAAGKVNLAPQLIQHLVNQRQKKVITFFERIQSAQTVRDDPALRLARGVNQTLRRQKDQPIWTRLYHSELKSREREVALKEFSDIGPSALLTCRALDEGLNVPSVDAALLVGSTQSPRQRLQRIGRALRRGSGDKKPVVIILYAKGTNDQNTMIGADDEEFKGVARVHHIGTENVLENVMEILDGREVSSLSSEPTSQESRTKSPTWPSLNWLETEELQRRPTAILSDTEQQVADLRRKLSRIIPGQIVDVTLATGDQIQGPFYRSGARRRDEQQEVAYHIGSRTVRLSEMSAIRRL